MIDSLDLAGNIVGTAQLLGITRHALMRRMIKLRIDHRPTAGFGEGWREGLEPAEKRAKKVGGHGASGL